MSGVMLLLILLGWLFAWRERRRAAKVKRDYSRRRVRDRRRLAARLKREGWDVLPLAMIGVEGPLLRDTEWNRTRQDMGHVPGEAGQLLGADDARVWS